MDLLLGSTSPRRQTLLKNFSIPFRTQAPLLNEETIPYKGDPHLHAKTLAELKSEGLQAELILTADTLVTLDQKLFGKPKTLDEAINTLMTLSGKTHTVITAICLRNNTTKVCFTETTHVQFHPLTKKNIETYFQHVTPFDKAGGYTIEGVGATIIQEIRGCITNVLGLPLGSLQKLFLEFNIDLWRYL